MSVITNRKVRTNQWSHRSDDEPLGTGNITVTLERRRAEHEACTGHTGKVGVRLRPGDAVEDLVPFLDGLELIAIEFDKFGEGRGYSQAYLLRERHGYRGELRALGARRDHVMFMERCGMDAFEPAPGETIAGLLAGFDAVTVRYQPSHDRVPLIFRRRALGAADTRKEIAV